MILLLFSGVVVEAIGKVTGYDSRNYQVVGLDEGG